MTAALAASEAEDDIDRIARQLDPMAAQLILARLLRRFSAKTEANTAVSPRVNGVAREEPVRRRGGPKRKEGYGDKTSLLIAELTRHPHAPIAALSRAIYGSDEMQQQKNVRSLLNGLKKAGKAINVEPGKWEVIPQK